MRAKGQRGAAGGLVPMHILRTGRLAPTGNRELRDDGILMLNRVGLAQG